MSFDLTILDGDGKSNDDFPLSLSARRRIAAASLVMSFSQVFFNDLFHRQKKQQRTLQPI
jgi:hypothetical protein